MSQARKPTSRRIAQQIATQTPRDVRLSAQRADHLTRYIHGLLPSNIRASVDVRISEHVDTAAVLPANEDELYHSKQTDLERHQAKQIVDSTDADYIVLITGKETATDSIPLDDQLTADSAFQFGAALHETLHIIKTAFKAVDELVKSEVEEQYQDYTRRLINITEDGAIEHEATTGNEFGNRPASRLRLVREILTVKVDGYSELPNQAREFSFGGAVEKALFDKLIFDSGVTDALLNKSDDRVGFSTDDEYNAFVEVVGEIESLAADILSIRSDHSDRLFEDDKEASIKRAKRTLQFWNDVLKPIKESPEESGQQGQQGQAGKSETAPNNPDESSGNSGGSNSESETTDNSGQSGVSESETTASDGPSDSDQQAENSPQTPLDSVDPENISFEPNSGDRSLQDLQEHPDIGDEPDPDTVDFEPAQQSAPESQSQSQSQSQPQPSSDSPADEGGGPPSASGQQEATEASLSGDDHNEGQQDSDSLESSHEADEDVDEDGNAQAESESSSGSSGDESEANQTPLSESTSSGGQSTFGDFFGDQSPTSESGSEESEQEPASAGRAESSGNDSGGDGESESKASDAEGEQPAGGDKTKQPLQDGRNESATPDRVPESESDTAATSGGDSVDTDTDTDTDAEETTDTDAGGDATPDAAEPAHSGDELTPDDFASDHDLAQRTADESTVDERALEEDLNTLAEAHAAERDSEDGSTHTSGSSVGGEESLGELSIMPTPTSPPPVDCDWSAVENDASLVGDTLAKQLRLDRRTGVRNGLCSGTTVNAKTAHRLAVKDPRVFSQEIAGREKEYFIVFVLDRSYSMSDKNLDRETGSKIDVATQALARFAVACEDLEIDVAITDFYGGDARLIKPPSVETSHVQDSILSTETSGGTPLAESLSLARKLADRDSKESIIITLTDGIPANVEEVIDEIKKSYSPICSLTVATDCNPNSPPADAERLDEEYDQSTIVYDAQDLDRRLDQFASLLGAY